MKNILYILFLIFIINIIHAQQDALTASITNAVNNCKTGEIDLYINGGYEPYSLVWKDSLGNIINGFRGITGNDGQEDLIGYYAGKYHVEVYDDLCGFVEADFEILNEKYNYSPNLSKINPSKCGANDGSLTVINQLEPTKGSGDFTYRWNKDGTFYSFCPPYTISGLSFGEYCLVATDNLYDCEFTKCDSVIASDEVLAKVDTIMNQSEDNIFDGEIHISVTKGSAPFTYSWVGPNGFTSNLKNITGLEKGMYYCTITSSNGCTKILNAYVLQYCKSPFVIFRVKNVCDNNGIGSISPNTQWNQWACNDFKFHWSNGSNECYINGPIGIYTVTITYQDTCIRIQEIEIKKDSTPIVTANITHICGDNSFNYGKIEIIGNYNYSFNWSVPGKSGKILYPILEPGVYKLTGIPPYPGCLIDTSFVIKQSPDINVTILESYSQCDPNAAAKIITQATGGIKPYKFFWNNVLGDSIYNFPISNTTKDSVLLKLQDSLGCVFTKYFYKPINNNIGVYYLPYPVCTTAKGAFVIESISNFQLPFTYQWSNGQTGKIMTGAEYDKEYRVTITDARGCTIVQRDMFVGKAFRNVGSYNPVVKHSCNGLANGFIDINKNDGDQRLMYWSTGKSGMNKNKLDSLIPGNYSLVLIEKSNEDCVFLGNYNINNISGNFPAKILSTCNDDNGSISIDQSLNKNNALSVKWGDVNSTAFDRYKITTGTYYATVTYYDCTFPSSYTVYNFSDTNSVTSKVLQPCKGFRNGFIQAIAPYGVAPLKYTWLKSPSDTIAINSEDNFISDLSNGFYYLTITDARGCKVSTIYNLLNKTSDTVDIGCERKIYCEGTLIKTIPKSMKGFVMAYIWNSAHDEIRIIASSNLIDSFNVTINKYGNNGWQQESKFRLNGTRDYLIATNGEYQVIISDGECERDYYFKVCTKDIHLCSTPKIIPCTGPNNNDGKIELKTPIFCSDNSSTHLTDTLNDNEFTFFWVRASDGYEFGVNENIISGLAADDYILKYRRNDCWSGLFQKTYTITCNCNISGVTSIITNSCPFMNNGKITLMYNNTNYTTKWSNGQNGVKEITGLAQGAYSVKIIENNTGCSKLFSFYVNSENVQPTHKNECVWEYNCNGQKYDHNFGIESVDPIPGSCDNLYTCNTYFNTYTKSGGSYYGNFRVVGETCLADKLCTNGNVNQRDIVRNVESFYDKQQCQKYNRCTYENQVYIIPNSVVNGTVELEYQLDTCKAIEYCTFADGSKYATGNVTKGTASWYNNSFNFGNTCDYTEECEIGKKKYYTNNILETSRDTCYYYQYYSGVYNCNIVSYCKKDPGNYTYNVFLTVITDTSDCIAKYNKYTKCDPNNLPFLQAEERNNIKTIDNFDIIKRIFPNPFDDKISIDIKTPKILDFNLNIYDMYGNVLLDKMFTAYPNINTVEILLPNFPSGVYNFVIKNKEYNISKNTKLIHIQN